MQNKNTNYTLSLSPMVAGMWRLADWELTCQQRLSLIHSCLDLGLTSFDHADIYGDYQCEALFGEAMVLAPELRSKMQIVTKCGIRLISESRPEHSIKRYDTSYEHILNSIENSLKQLNTDYIDCVLIHRPDPLMGAAEVARAFEDLIQQGKILSAGVSNFLPHQLSLLQEYCDFPLAINQIEVSVLSTDAFYDGSLDYCQQHRMIPMAWSPLGGGKLFTGESEQARRVVRSLSDIGEQLGASPDKVAFAWLLKYPGGIKPIIGSGNIERIKAAVSASKISLSDEHWFEILQASQGHPVP